MAGRRELIKQMIEMQRRFIAYEHEHGLNPADYYAPAPDHPLHGYRRRYTETAMKLVDLAHQHKGSQR